jgi:hypothetical protein
MPIGSVVTLGIFAFGLIVSTIGYIVRVEKRLGSLDTMEKKLDLLSQETKDVRGAQSKAESRLSVVETQQIEDTKTLVRMEGKLDRLIDRMLIPLPVAVKRTRKSNETN